MSKVLGVVLLLLVSERSYASASNPLAGSGYYYGMENGQNVTYFEVYRVHQVLIRMKNVNAANPRGEIGFLVPEYGYTDGVILRDCITHIWSDAGFGPYESCNGGSCGIAGYPHSSTNPATNVFGRSNPLSGNWPSNMPQSVQNTPSGPGWWYSVPAQGQCSENQTIGFGPNDCTWRGSAVTLTVDYQPLNSKPTWGSSNTWQNWLTDEQLLYQAFDIRSPLVEAHLYDFQTQTYSKLDRVISPRAQYKCKALCTPGYFSPTGIDETNSPCIPCPMNQYNDAPGLTQCTACPAGFVTYNNGTDSRAGCLRSTEASYTFTKVAQPVDNLDDFSTSNLVANLDSMSDTIGETGLGTDGTVLRYCTSYVSTPAATYSQTGGDTSSLATTSTIGVTEALNLDESAMCPIGVSLGGIGFNCTWSMAQYAQAVSRDALANAGFITCSAGVLAPVSPGDCTGSVPANSVVSRNRQILATLFRNASTVFVDPTTETQTTRNFTAVALPSERCLAFCPPGTSSLSGKEPCSQCPPNTFASALVGATQCTPCPFYHASPVGSGSASACKMKSPVYRDFYLLPNSVSSSISNVNLYDLNGVVAGAQSVISWNPAKYIQRQCVAYAKMAWSTSSWCTSPPCPPYRATVSNVPTGITAYQYEMTGTVCPAGSEIGTASCTFSTSPEPTGFIIVNAVSISDLKADGFTTTCNGCTLTAAQQKQSADLVQKRFDAGEVETYACHANNFPACTKLSFHAVADPNDGCRAKCPPGTNSSTGYIEASDSCQVCAPGTYAAGLGNTQCTPCPSGMSTEGTGASSHAHCKFHLEYSDMYGFFEQAPTNWTIAQSLPQSEVVSSPRAIIGNLAALATSSSIANGLVARYCLTRLNATAAALASTGINPAIIPSASVASYPPTGVTASITDTYDLNLPAAGMCSRSKVIGLSSNCSFSDIPLLQVVQMQDLFNNGFRACTAGANPATCQNSRLSPSDSANNLAVLESVFANFSQTYAFFPSSGTFEPISERLVPSVTNQCQAFCPPGTYSSSGKATTLTNPAPSCRSCAAGTFQSQYGKTACQACPFDHFTKRAAAISQAECYKVPAVSDHVYYPFQTQWSSIQQSIPFNSYQSYYTTAAAPVIANQNFYNYAPNQAYMARYCVEHINATVAGVTTSPRSAYLPSSVPPAGYPDMYTWTFSSFGTQCQYGTALGTNTAGFGPPVRCLYRQSPVALVLSFQTLIDHGMEFCSASSSGFGFFCNSNVISNQQWFDNYHLITSLFNNASLAKQYDTSTGVQLAHSVDIRDDCTAWCGLGTYSSDGKYTSGVGCTLCDLGSYQDKTGSTNCTVCPMGASTKAKGATSISDCLLVDMFDQSLAFQVNDGPLVNAEATWNAIAMLGTSGVNITTTCILFKPQSYPFLQPENATWWSGASIQYPFNPSTECQNLTAQSACTWARSPYAMRAAASAMFPNTANAKMQTLFQYAYNVTEFSLPGGGVRDFTATGAGWGPKCSHPCAPGFYGIGGLSHIGALCKPCPQDTYATTPRSASCTRCPVGTSTFGMSGSVQCRAVPSFATVLYSEETNGRSPPPIKDMTVWNIDGIDAITSPTTRVTQYIMRQCTHLPIPGAFQWHNVSVTCPRTNNKPVTCGAGTSCCGAGLGRSTNTFTIPRQSVCPMGQTQFSSCSVLLPEVTQILDVGALKHQFPACFAAGDCQELLLEAFATSGKLAVWNTLTQQYETQGFNGIVNATGDKCTVLCPPNTTSATGLMLNVSQGCTPCPPGMQSGIGETTCTAASTVTTPSGTTPSSTATLTTSSVSSSSNVPLTTPQPTTLVLAAPVITPQPGAFSFDSVNVSVSCADNTTVASLELDVGGKVVFSSSASPVATARYPDDVNTTSAATTASKVIVRGTCAKNGFRSFADQQFEYIPCPSPTVSPPGGFFKPNVTISLVQDPRYATTVRMSVSGPTLSSSSASLQTYMGPFSLSRSQGSANFTVLASSTRQLPYGRSCTANISASFQIAAPCQPGSFSLTADSQCQPCPANSFVDSIAASACNQCPANSGSGRMGQTNITGACDSCLAGSAGTAPYNCTACPMGSFASAAATSCTACPAGTTTSTIGATTCKAVCQPGQYGPSGIAPCSPCAAGSYQGSSQSSACSSCPAMSTTDNLAPGSTVGFTAVTDCKNCVAGTSGDPVSGSCTACLIGTWASAGQQSCNPCPQGTTTLQSSSTTASSCKSRCLAGEVGVGGLSPCSKCPLGQFSANAGASACTLCSQGKTTLSLGQTVCIDQCPVGTYLPNNNPSNSCTNCPLGTFASSLGTSECTRCLSGTSTSATGAVSSTACTQQCRPGEISQTGFAPCTPCPKGQYQASSGGQQCSPCPSGQGTASTGATSAAQCTAFCPAGESSATGLAPCTPCPVGSFSNAQSATQCTNCPSGQTTSAASSSSSAACTTICQPGQFGSSGLGPCTSCPVGTYSSAARATSCTSCQQGTSTPSPGSMSSSQCLSACSAGSFSATGLAPCTTCTIGTYAPSQQSKSCAQCPAGATTISAGSTSSNDCKFACSAGSSSSSGFSPCNPCAVGTYVANNQATSCTPCPAGTSTISTGSSSSSSCLVPCNAGTYGSNGFAPCQACGKGTYSGSKAVSCVSCPSGKSTSGTGASDVSQCLDVCPAGKYSSTGVGQCADCPTGSYTSLQGATQCVSCPTGQTTAAPGSTSCIAICQPGQFTQNPSGLGSCQQCLAGTYSSAERSTACTPCQQGTSTPSSGSSSASDCRPLCSAGTYGPGGVQNAQGACTNCAQGTYASGTGTVQCSSCPATLTTATDGATSASQCDVCAPGHVEQSQGQGCTACPVGSFAAFQASACTQCSGALSTAAPAATAASDCKAVCQAGTFSATGGVGTCSECPIGTYSSASRKTQCAACDLGSSTVATGSNAASACEPICLPGTFSTTGLGACVSCPQGSFSSVDKATACSACPANTNTPGVASVGCLQALTIVSPTSTSLWISSDTRTMGWEWIGTVPSVNVTLNQIIGGTYTKVLASNVPNAGSLTFTVPPEAPTGSYVLNLAAGKFVTTSPEFKIENRTALPAIPPVVVIKAVLSIDFTATGAPGSLARTEFITTLVTNIASALSISINLVEVFDIKPASVAFSTRIFPDVAKLVANPKANITSPEVLGAQIVQQMNDPQSPLRQMNLTSAILSAEIFNPNLNPSPEPIPPPKDKDAGQKGGGEKINPAIIGGAVGGGVFLIAAVVGGVLLLRRNQHKTKKRLPGDVQLTVAPARSTAMDDPEAAGLEQMATDDDVHRL